MRYIVLCLDIMTISIAKSFILNVVLKCIEN